MNLKNGIVAGIVLLASLASLSRAEELLDISVAETDEGAAVTVGEAPFTVYRKQVGNKPILWPLVGPTGKRMTRGYPIDPQPGESNDHLHQIGYWLTHGNVNGITFWENSDRAGSTVHRKFTKLAGGKRATVAAEVDWLDRQGKRVCRDEREYAFSATPDARWIDVTLKLIASDGPLKFGDDKEGSFGLRVADSMRVDAKLGGKVVSSEGLTDDAAWGQPAKWVDYYGPVDDEQLGVAIFDHPKNLGHPTRWHVRYYGLFAANPFTQHAFDEKLPPLEVKIPAGESLTYRYRVLLHKGDEKVGNVATQYQAFVDE